MIRNTIRTLAMLPTGSHAVVVTVQADPEAKALSESHQQLHAMGFEPGAPVRVLRRAWPGGDPMIVRVGSSMVALRRAEAELVVLERDGT